MTTTLQEPVEPDDIVPEDSPLADIATDALQRGKVISATCNMTGTGA